jgi:glyoxalase family protein
MQPLNGIHHISAITADAPRNLEFYAGVMGLRLVKKTVNQDNPTVYHLFYADEDGSPGADLTFFEYPGLVRGRAGAGMIHRIAFRVASENALDFWAKRLAGAGIESERNGGVLRFQDPEGLGLELLVEYTDDGPLTAAHPEIPEQLALQGFAGVRAFTTRPEPSDEFLTDTLGFTPVTAGAYESRGESRGSFYVYDQAPDLGGIGGAGTVHHVAWASTMNDHVAWRNRVFDADGQPTPVIDRFYFRSIYFREPSGVLFEVATIGPGFTADEPKDHLGEKLSLPPAFEHLRAQIEPNLTPLVNPRQRAGARPTAAAS